MRIISNFHDYYDCIQAYGQDQKFMYMRKPQLFLLDNNPFSEARLYHYHRDIEHHEYFIGFCGKIYPLTVVSYGPWGEPDIKSVCYTVEDVDAFINEHYDKKTIKRYYDKKGWGWFRQGCVQQFFKDGKALQDRHEKMFIDSSNPLFVLDTWRNADHKFRLNYNTSLKKFKFFKIFPTVLAYQEISMYLGGVLGQANPTIPEISNEDKIASKGFDKYSFRKDKQK